jgi:hypothetical protein
MDKQLNGPLQKLDYELWCVAARQASHWPSEWGSCRARTSRKVKV